MLCKSNQVKYPQGIAKRKIKKTKNEENQWNYKSSFLCFGRKKNMKNAFPLLRLLARQKEKSNLHWISAIYLSRNIPNHQQNITYKRTWKGNPCEQSAELAIKSSAMFWLNVKMIKDSFWFLGHKFLSIFWQHFSVKFPSG